MQFENPHRKDDKPQDGPVGDTDDPAGTFAFLGDWRRYPTPYFMREKERERS
jgi:hypothetical protein